MKKLFVANWKRYLTTSESVSLWLELAKVSSEGFDVVVAPNHLALDQIAAHPGSHMLAAQDAFYETEGAITGMVSTQDLKEIGVTHVIVGHSERRALARETDDVIAKKVAAVQAAQLTPILCVGETKEERDAGKAQDRVREQVTKGISQALMGAALIIAYEPRWAISKGGVGESCHPEDAERMLSFIKEIKLTPVLYGGSVKPENITSFVELESCDGVLVGSASTKLDSLQAMLS